MPEWLQSVVAVVLEGKMPSARDVNVFLTAWCLGMILYGTFMATKRRDSRRTVGVCIALFSAATLIACARSYYLTWGDWWFFHRPQPTRLEQARGSDGALYIDWNALASNVEYTILNEQHGQGEWCKVNLVIRFDKNARSNVDVDYISVVCPRRSSY